MRALACLLALAAAPAARAVPSVAIVSLDAPPDLTFTGKAVAVAVAEEAARAGSFVVLGPDAIEKRLGRAATALLVSCADDSRCLADRAGKALGVDRAIAGWLERRDGAYRVRLVHADVKTGARLGAFEREIPVAARRLQKDVALAAVALLRGEADATGLLKIESDVAGADVAIDGEPAGRTPVARAVKPGKHHVQVWKTDHAPAEPVWVDVPANGVVVHRPRLFEIPARERGVGVQDVKVEVVK